MLHPITFSRNANHHRHPACEVTQAYTPCPYQLPADDVYKTLIDPATQISDS